MKNIIIITLIALCACTGIQLPENHTAVETFKSKFFDIDKSYPKEWRNNVTEGDRYNTVNKYYKLSFMDIDWKLHITKNCYQCALKGSNIRVYIQHNSDFDKLFIEVYNNTHPKSTQIKGTVYANDIDRACCNNCILVDWDSYIWDTDWMEFDGAKMKLITPEMEKELNAKEINLHHK